MDAADLKQPREVPLKDGRVVLVRPIAPSDKEALRDGLRRMTAETRYRRFMATLEDLTPSQLRYLTEIDYDDHMAWCAFDPALEGRGGVGVARYIRLRDRPEAAEAAVAVVDSHQGVGLGTALLTLLGLSAIENGVKVFCGHIYEHNRPVLDMLERLGARLERDQDQLMRAEIPLPSDPKAFPDTRTGRVFRAAAEELVHLIHFPLPPAPPPPPPAP